MMPFHIAENPIPDGFQIYEDTMPVAGIHHYRRDVQRFVRGKGHELEFLRDPDNRFDSNAIKVIGRAKGWFGEKSRMLGYVPADVARRIVQGNWFEMVRPRLAKTRVGRDGYVEVEFQILGPRGRKKEYLASLLSKTA